MPRLPLDLFLCVCIWRHPVPANPCRRQPTVWRTPSGVSIWSADWPFASGSRRCMLLPRSVPASAEPASPSVMSANTLGVLYAGNELRGTLSAGLPATLQRLDLSYNTYPGSCWADSPGITGQLPSFSSLSSLTFLNLDSNCFTGTLPSLPASLLELYLNYNK